MLHQAVWRFYVSPHVAYNTCSARVCRYAKMAEEVQLFNEWYRPHNERLYKLIGHDFMW